MSHTSGGGHGHGGDHGAQGGHPDQSPGWNGALQVGERPITSLPNPTILPIFFALFVFVLMLLPFVINWDADGVELPWAHKRNQVSQEQSLQQQTELQQRPQEGPQAGPQAGPQGSYQTTADLAGSTAQQSNQAQAQEQAANNAPPASYEQQLLYASQQSYDKNANQQTQAVNPSAQQNYTEKQNYAAQPSYSQMGYPQENYEQNYAPIAQPQRRHRVFVER